MRRIVTCLWVSVLGMVPISCRRTHDNVMQEAINKLQLEQQFSQLADATLPFLISFSQHDRVTQKSPRVPTGLPPRLSCASMRQIIEQVHSRLATEINTLPSKDSNELIQSVADNTIEWLDPFGLWATAPDSPVATLFHSQAKELYSLIHGNADCATILKPIGSALVDWTRELRVIYQEALTKPKAPSTFEQAINEVAFEKGTITRNARDLARILGERAAALQTKSSVFSNVLTTARMRWFPDFEASQWAEVVLAALVRAYVPLIDPHGGWAPLDEVVTLYDRALEAEPPSRLWLNHTRTAIGIRVNSGTIPPLQEGDVVISMDGNILAGLSSEAIEQFAETPENVELKTRTLEVWRTHQMLTLHVPSHTHVDSNETLEKDFIPLSTGHALVIRSTDVPDTLGREVSRLIASAKSSSKSLTGIILDLRSNGGGSIEGATTTLGLFLPGAPLFPLKHRDGAIETERASEPPVEERWAGPVAALVDGATASAAEMIAGALRAYRRGLVFGTTTYGKGCAQEYFEDATGHGLIRLSTLLFALPDGSPVQKIGIKPDIFLPMQPQIGHWPDLKTASTSEREADLTHALPTWNGPDVRDLRRVSTNNWPQFSVSGVCSSPVVCSVLRTLGSSKAHNIAKR